MCLALVMGASAAVGLSLCARVCLVRKQRSTSKIRWMYKSPTDFMPFSVHSRASYPLGGGVCSTSDFFFRSFSLMSALVRFLRLCVLIACDPAAWFCSKQIWIKTLTGRKVCAALLSRETLEARNTMLPSIAKYYITSIIHHVGVDSDNGSFFRRRTCVTKGDACPLSASMPA